MLFCKRVNVFFSFVLLTIACNVHLWGVFHMTPRNQTAEVSSNERCSWEFRVVFFLLYEPFAGQWVSGGYVAVFVHFMPFVLFVVDLESEWPFILSTTESPCQVVVVCVHKTCFSKHELWCVQFVFRDTVDGAPKRVRKQHPRRHQLQLLPLFQPRDCRYGNAPILQFTQPFSNFQSAVFRNRDLFTQSGSLGIERFDCGRVDVHLVATQGKFGGSFGKFATPKCSVDVTWFVFGQHPDKVLRDVRFRPIARTHSSKLDNVCKTLFLRELNKVRHSESNQQHLFFCLGSFYMYWNKNHPKTFHSTFHSTFHCRSFLLTKKKINQ